MHSKLPFLRTGLPNERGSALIPNSYYCQPQMDRWWWKPLRYLTLVGPFIAVGVYYHWFL